MLTALEGWHFFHIEFQEVKMYRFKVLDQIIIQLNSYKPGVPFVGHRQTKKANRREATEGGFPTGAILFA